MNPNIDPQTQKVLKDGEILANLVDSDGWKMAKKRLCDSLLTVMDIMTLEKKDDIVQEIGARQLAVQLVMNWISEIEGTANQHTSNVELLKTMLKEDYIGRLDPQ